MRCALRGINLGGWLVVERWITTDVFDGVTGPAEIDIVRELGYDVARKRLDRHRATFITEKDFAWLSREGFDFVRLPVGYWLFEQTDDFIDGEIYIQKVFRWAEKHAMKIILDFHGLQGSQNGKDHSGQVRKVALYKGDNRGAALRTLEYMARTYGHEPALLGLGVINEPQLPLCASQLIRYYDRAYRVVRPYLNDEVKIIVSDAFAPLKVAQKLARRSYGKHIVLDVHLYQLFSRQDQKMSFEKHIMTAEERWRDLIDEVQRYVPVLVGEWSAALDPSTYEDGQGSEAERVSDYYLAQKRTFDDSVWAHAYWTYKAPKRGTWDWRASHRILENK
ncbi:MAG: cellulase family glycosylhydrolase [Candidatus Saccharimonadales bacterium]